MSLNRGILPNGVLGPKLYNIHFASYILINIYFY